MSQQRERCVRACVRVRACVCVRVCACVRVACGAPTHQSPAQIAAMPSLVSLPSGVSQPCLTRASWRCRRNCGHTALGGAFHVLSVSAVTPCFVTLPSLTQPFCAYSCADSVRPVVGLAVGRA